MLNKINNILLSIASLIGIVVLIPLGLGFLIQAVRLDHDFNQGVEASKVLLLTLGCWFGSVGLARLFISQVKQLVSSKKK